MTEVVKIKHEIEKNFQDENVCKIQDLQMENESLKSNLDYFRGAKEELMWENSNLKQQLTMSNLENSVLKDNIQKMKLNEMALEEQVAKLKKKRIPCSHCKKLCNSEKSLQRHIADKHIRNNDF